MTLNSKALGRYEVTARKANTTISSFVANDWFTTTKDTTSSWIVVNGNLTVNSGQTIIPPVRKLFVVVYVTGNLTFTGAEFSMTSRGANHSGTGDSGGYVAPQDIRLATGTFNGVLDYTPGSVTNPTIPATGGAGGAGSLADGSVAGTPGTGGMSGGGSGGVSYLGGVTRSGAGSAGTCFSGGSGGGGQYTNNAPAATSAIANGGAGGNAGGITQAGGGAGNPGGSGIGGWPAGGTGTGGTLIIICEGFVNGGGGGTLTTRGVAGGIAGGINGGGSGGGSLTLLYGALNSLSGAYTTGGGATGENGGSGSWRRFAIGAN